ISGSARCPARHRRADPEIVLRQARHGGARFLGPPGDVERGTGRDRRGNRGRRAVHVPMMRPRARFLALALTALATGASCGEPYAVRNPYDPDFPVTFTITGPDSVHSLGDVVQYAA